MVQLTRIYTKTGDKGKTSLGNGKRIEKDSLRLEAIGTLDEVNALLGIVRLHTEGDIDTLLARIQNDLFDLGADLCRPEEFQEKTPALRMIQEQVLALEKALDFYNESLVDLTSFILPGGSAAAAYMHLARTVTRRAERVIVTLHKKEPLNEVIIPYINRLSDLFFVLSRFLNKQGKEDVLWVPGAHR